ncbi:hypothetical protein HanHA300_Chr07g0251141 [Helianthus annuus]|nr:hypothetical protein HanHA300_Chr07g0251141 [Helianthus annuus]
MSYDDYLKKNVEATAAQGLSVEKIDKSAKHVEPEGVVHSDSSDADDESTETEPEIDVSKIGYGKVQLKKKPLKKKKKGSDDEDSTYTPTAEEKKKLRIKRKAVQTGVIPRNVRARKGSASMAEGQSDKSEKHVTTSKCSEAEKDQNVEVPKVPEVQKKAGADDEVEITNVRVSTPPPPPEHPEVPESSKPKKTVLPDLFEGFPNIHGEYKDDILSGEESDMLHDASIKALEKKVSILEKEKAKAQVDRDELKKQLEELMKVNEEIKSVMIKQAKKIKKIEGDVDNNAQLFEQLSMEITDLHLKNKKLNEINQMINSLLSELHEASANEFKAMKLEMEALRADKAVKDEQLNMLYIVMEHHLGIDVQSIYNNIEIKRVKERRAQREKELAKAATQRKKGLVVDTEEILSSSSQADVEMMDTEVDPKGFMLVERR